MDDTLNAFLAELTDLSVEHRIMITEDGVPVIMEHDDLPYSYYINDDDKLARR